MVSSLFGTLRREDVFASTRVLAITFQSAVDNFVWVAANMYRPNENLKRMNFWGFISFVRLHWDMPWCFGGNFNVVRFPHGKRGESVTSNILDCFSDFIKANEFIDLPFSGEKLTWSNKQERAIMTWIDRFLSSLDWEEHFPGVIQAALGRGLSDHMPIKLSTELVDWGHRPFRFKNSWLLQNDFLFLVKEWWDQNEVHGLRASS